ncbi:class I SAM-dependent methyltransferase [Piscinibacter sakaiensis]|uniref:class I SAM-dependent DNA methyltransferase n=1 Tax=Piscinibacter sakaiensis TaxID=1547922 RepID=UPI003729338B
MRRLPPPARVLDLGCANGRLGPVVRRRFPAARLSGVDVSSAMVEAARASGLYESVRRHDLARPLDRWDTGSAELVLALGCLEFLAEPAALLREVARVLVPGGHLLASFQAHWPDRPALAPRSTRSADVRHHALTEDEVAGLFDAPPWRLEALEGVTGYVSATGFACPYWMVQAGRQGGPPRAE